jgi:lipoprotein-releasing system permease protein
MSGSVTGIEYKLADIERTQAIGRVVDETLGGYPYYTKDWMQMNRNLFSALKLEKIAMFIILMALVLMASLLILVALIMVVIEKGKEIAILKSMGATDASIMKIFVTYGLSIGTLGSGIGLALGCLVCFAIQSFGIGLDPEVYYITHIPVRIDSFEIALVTFGALVISFLATIPPSLFAARLKPVDGLRYE